MSKETDEIANLKERCAVVEANLQAHQAFVQKVQNPEIVAYGVVLFCNKQRVALVRDGGVVEFANHDGRDLRVGQYVKIDPQSLYITSEADFTAGEVAVVMRCTGEQPCFQLEVEVTGGSPQVVYSGFSAKVGERIVVDKSKTVATHKLAVDTQAHKPQNIKVFWDQIGGQDAAKKLIQDAILRPRKHKQLYASYGRKPVKGICMYGAPGCGKTLLAMAVATEIAGEGDASFFKISGPEILSMWVGNSEAQIRRLFATSREAYRDSGSQPVLFIDEADAILATRGSHRSSDVDKTIVPQFLSEMDGMNGEGPLVILATNKVESLDPAVLREGRIDFKVKLDRPDLNAAQDILGVHLRDKPLKKTDTLVSRVTSYLFSQPQLVKNVSGAMLAQVVQQGIDNALNRDIEGAAKKPSGLTEADLVLAVDQLALSYNNLGTSNDQRNNAGIGR